MAPPECMRGGCRDISVYIALLRGINVGGHKPVKMAVLKQLCESMGLGHVQTYIQSGNVVFATDEAAEPLRRRLEQAIAGEFGFSVPTMLASLDELEQIILECPLKAENEGESLFVALLAEAPAAEGIERMMAVKTDPDEFRIAGRAVYILCRRGFADSVFGKNVLEKKLGVSATVRNWQTMNKLIAMGKACD